LPLEISNVNLIPHNSIDFNQKQFKINDLSKMLTFSFKNMFFRTKSIKIKDVRTEM